MLKVQVRVVPGMPNSIWMLSSEDSSIAQRQINMIEIFNKLVNMSNSIVSIYECIIY